MQQRLIPAFLAGYLSFLSGCGGGSADNGSGSLSPGGDGINNIAPMGIPMNEMDRFDMRARRFTTASEAIIVGGSTPIASRAGLKVLKEGGSAMDAALTVALTQNTLWAGSVVSFAGFIYLVYYDAAERRTYSLIGGPRSPLLEDDPLSIPNDPFADPTGKPSGRAVLVPGFMAGIEAAHRRFGRLPWDRLFEPAIYYAETGFKLYPSLAGIIGLRQEALKRLPEGRQIFTKANGELYQFGEVFKQRALAKTLRHVAHQGADYMYTGEWGRKFVRTVQREGGTIILEDLANYQVIWSEPVRASYRDQVLYSLGRPAPGGVALVEGLNILENLNIEQLGHYTQSPEALYWLMKIARVQTLFNYFPGIEEYLGNYYPGIDFSPQARLDKATSRFIFEQLQAGEWEKNAARALADWMVASPSPVATEHTDTIVVKDSAGNIAAITHTSNGAWGSMGIFVDGVSVPDPGGHYKNFMHRNVPGTMLFNNMAPLILFKNGEPVLASSASGVSLYEATLQSLYSVFQGLEVDEAAALPKFWSPVADGPQPLQAQAIPTDGFSASLLEDLAALGQPTQTIDQNRAYLYNSNWIGLAIDNTIGTIKGAAMEGSAVGY